VEILIGLFILVNVIAIFGGFIRAGLSKRLTG